MRESKGQDQNLANLSMLAFIMPKPTLGRHVLAYEHSGMDFHCPLPTVLSHLFPTLSFYANHSY